MAPGFGALPRRVHVFEANLKDEVSSGKLVELILVSPA